ncbi:MAG: DUF6340 family protein [Prolixibacteraceae bacterium]
MKRKSGFLWFVLLLSLSSCISFEQYSIEVYKPAELTLPVEMKKIAIISRNLKFENDTLQNYQKRNRRLIRDKIEFNTDSLALQACLDSLSTKLLSQNRFDSIMIVPIAIMPERRVNEIKFANPDWYKNNAEHTHADGLIILDMFSCFYSSNDDGDYSPLATVVTTNIWSVYDAKKQKVIDRYAQIDTLYWDGTDDGGKFKKNLIPEKKAAIPLAAGIVGENYSKRILPGWSMVYRDIMTCKKPDLKKAAEQAEKNKWDEAAGVWEKYVESKNSRNRIIALYNLALSNEMSGNIEKALELTAKAAESSSGFFMSMENEVVRNYAAVLYKRQKELVKLQSQHEPQ